MTISDHNRRRFEMIGKDRLALALATGTLQALGLTEDMKAEAMEWVAEQRRLEDTRNNSTRRWTIVAAVASVIAAVAAVWGLFR